MYHAVLDVIYHHTTTVFRKSYNCKEVCMHLETCFQRCIFYREEFKEHADSKYNHKYKSLH